MTAAEKYLAAAPGQRVLFRPGASGLDSALSGIFSGVKSAVLFTGRGSADRSGAFAAISAAASSAGCRLARFAEIESEPGMDTVAAMRDFLAGHPAETVLAVGGGSVLDAAKAAYLIFQSGWELERHFGTDKYSSCCPESGLKRIVAIPTTSGTGSECTAYSNIVDRGHGVKKLICERLILPETAVIHPAFTASVPHGVTLATGCDALAHLLEGLLNVRADGNHPEANRWALEGVALICEHLPRVLADPDNAASREAMSLAAALGGMVIRHKSTGLPHLCSFSWFGRIEHGIAAVLLLPAAWRYYLGEPSVAVRTMELRRLFGGETPAAVIDGFRSFLTRVGVPESLAAYAGITPELLKKTAASGRENPMKLELAPRRVPLERSVGILSEILAESSGKEAEK